MTNGERARRMLRAAEELLAEAALAQAERVSSLGWQLAQRLLPPAP